MKMVLYIKFISVFLAMNLIRMVVGWILLKTLNETRGEAVLVEAPGCRNGYAYYCRVRHKIRPCPRRHWRGIKNLHKEINKF